MFNTVFAIGTIKLGNKTIVVIVGRKKTIVVVVGIDGEVDVLLGVGQDSFPI